MKRFHPRRATFRVGPSLFVVLLVLAGCVSPPAAPVGGPAAGAPSPGGDAAMATHEAAAHEAQMQDPAAMATHEAQMQDPAAMATHEAQMHGPATPTPAASTALSTFATADFAGSGLCVMCHEGLVDAAGLDVSITTHWRSTMMANAAKDPAWRAKVASEVARNPALGEVIEKKCAACHTPMAVAQAETDGVPAALTGEGFLAPANALHGAAQEGVSCTLCHQITAENLGTSESFTGGYVIDAATEPPDRVIYGPYEDPFGRPMQMHSGYVPAYGEHTAKAGLCGTCHNLYTPYVDAAGEVRGEFPEQTPYTEWESSAFGKGGVACQTCHMPAATGGVVISPMPAWLEPREPFFQHYFVGGNAFMVALLRDHADELGVTADTVQLDATAQRAAVQLKQGASLAVKEAARDGQVLVAKVEVGTDTGHKFPTSFPARRAWLHVTVTDASGKTVYESGKPRADGSIEDNDADADPLGFEPHYDVIEAAGQVQIYEPIMGNTDGEVTYTLLRAARYLKDNRLLPAGFDKAGAPADIAVYGEASGDANFGPGGDTVTYRIDVADGAAPFDVRVELLYQPLGYRFVQDMASDAGEAGTTFGRLFAAADKTPSVVAVVEAVRVD